MLIKNFNHVKAFLQVIDSGSIQAASRRLRKSQTSISNSVVKLEIDLGIDLLCREGHKAMPTKEAIKLLPYLRNLLDYSHVIDGVVDSLQTSKLALEIFVDNAIPSSICQAIEHLIVSQQFETVTIKRGSPADSMKFLRDNGAQVAITIHEELKTKHFSQSVLGYCRGVVVCHRDFPLANASITCASDLVRYRQICLSCSDSEVAPCFRPVSDDVCYVEQFYDMKSLIMQELGWGVLPLHIVKDSLDDGTLIDLSKHYEDGGILTKVYCYFNTQLLHYDSFKHFLEASKRITQPLEPVPQRAITA
ncbi:LysR family transcriptional regulator [Zobellella sp. DQSA1]|uniref:LysR family transcriptional regulator n=1 Tax=Zobellella sp. DQSA1 TaxID=3342386 RepID=UPI0035C2545D